MCIYKNNAYIEIHSRDMDIYFIKYVYFVNACEFFQSLLGAQLVITLIMVSIIQKLSPHFSFARWILCSTGYVHI